MSTLTHTSHRPYFFWDYDFSEEQVRDRSQVAHIRPNALIHLDSILLDADAIVARLRELARNNH